MLLFFLFLHSCVVSCYPVILSSSSSSQFPVLSFPVLVPAVLLFPSSQFPVPSFSVMALAVLLFPVSFQCPVPFFLLLFLALLLFPSFSYSFQFPGPSFLLPSLLSYSFPPRTPSPSSFQLLISRNGICHLTLLLFILRLSATSQPAASL